MTTTTVAVIWLLVASRVPALVRRRHDSVFYVALTAAVAVTLMFGPVAAAIDDVTGFLDLSSLLSGCAIMLAFGLFRSAIIRAIVSPDEQPKALHRGMLQTSVAITVYVVAFLCSLVVGATYGVGVPGGSPDLGSHSDTGVFVFLMTLCGFLLVASVEVARACVKYVPAMTSKMFRIGFGLVAAGCAATSVSVVSKMARQVLVLFYVETPWADALQGLWTVCYNTAGVLISVGLFLPAVSRPVARFEVVERYHLLRLQPIWLRAAATAPTLVTRARSPLRGALSRAPRHRLHRVLVEILDSEMVATGEVISSPARQRLVEHAERVLES